MTEPNEVWYTKVWVEAYLIDHLKGLEKKSPKEHTTNIQTKEEESISNKKGRLAQIVKLIQKGPWVLKNVYHLAEFQTIWCDWRFASTNSNKVRSKS